MPTGIYYPTLSEQFFHAGINYLGMPYESVGSSDRLDCSQLFVNVFRVCGFGTFPDMTAADLRKQLFTLVGPPETGPIVGAIFRREGGKVVHIGLLSPSGSVVLHATKADGRVVVKALELVEYSEITFLDVPTLMNYYTKGIRVQTPTGPGSTS